jgi:hypothetical protein
MIRGHFELILSDILLDFYAHKACTSYLKS